MKLSHIINHSRPRFRLYVIGPFLLGYAAAITDYSQFLWIWFVWWLLYFTLPANVLIYGANDIADYETDKNNPKKQSYESLLTPDKQKTMRVLIAITNIPFLVWSMLQWQSIFFVFLLFWFFGIFYSSKPIRAKAIPFLDGIFNVLYIVPWFLWYIVAWWTHIDVLVIIVGTLRCMAMHAYSAIPDIDADRQAWLATTATALGKTGTLLYCLLCRVFAAIWAYTLIGWWAVVFGSVYVVLIVFSSFRELFTLYKRFPLINAVVGMLLFFVVLFWL